mmetsp:Transcript_7395/g.16209  ORF Transcript_7395/g.16209 Transcript_7395/m.16209 type:complete len:299 (-) Transcript_7395:357-1253(-)
MFDDALHEGGGGGGAHAWRLREVDCANACCERGVQTRLDHVGAVVHAQVPEHHAGGEDQRSGVRYALAGDVWGGAVNSLEDGYVISDISRGRHTQPAHQPRSEVRYYVALQVWQHDDVKHVGPGDELHGQIVYDDVICAYVRILLRYLVKRLQEQPVGEFHDVGLVAAGYAVKVLVGPRHRDLEGLAVHLQAPRARDEPAALSHIVRLHVLHPPVRVLDILPHYGQIDVYAGPGEYGLHPRQRLEYALIGVSAPHLARRHVDALHARALRSLHRSLEQDPRLLDLLLRGLRHACRIAR